MLTRIKMILFPLAIFLASAWLTADATVKVTNLYLQKNSQFTEFSIQCDGAFEFTHQIVEPAGNKSYRIVVDVKDALQALPQQLYKDLPSGAVKQVRTSQYSSDPEKVVRVVLDVAGSLTYKVKNEGNLLTLFISTPSEKDFPKWSATQTTETKPIMAKTETPKPMPLHPDVPQVTPNTPKTPSSDPQNPGPQLAAKPIDESKLLNKKTTTSSSTSNKAATQTQSTSKSTLHGSEKTLASLSTGANQPASTPQGEKSKSSNTTAAKTPETKSQTSETKTAGTTPVTPPAVNDKKSGAIQEPSKKSTNPVSVNTVVDKSSGKTTSKTDTAPKTATGSPATPPLKTEAMSTKPADSATLPSNKPSSPKSDPADATKPPKVQKSALPDPKVNKSPKLTDNTGTADPTNAKIGTASQASPPPTSAVQTADNSGAETAIDSSLNALKAKSEAVRQRYLANREKNNPNAGGLGGDSMAGATEPKPLAGIDKIREKYKHGIQFVQDDQDEEKVAESQQLSDDTDDTEQPQTTVGPYSEFLPERQIVVYSTNGRPDPFEPLVEDATSNSKGGEFPDVETLRLVGILDGKRGSRALFEDYNGYSYTLKIGDRVKNGFVLSIEDTRVMFQIRQYGWNRQVAIDLDNEK